MMNGNLESAPTFANIIIGSDHDGFLMKETIVGLLRRSFTIRDVGAKDANVTIDYPDCAHKVVTAISAGHGDVGILISGSGNGMAMTANRHPNIRCAVCWSKETAAVARQHCDANIISIPATFVSQKDAIEMIDIFLDTEFDYGTHTKRNQKIEH